MDLNKQKKPSLPRLATDLPPNGTESPAAHPQLAIKALQDPNVKVLRPEIPAAPPILFGEDQEDDENVAPTVRYAPVRAKTVYVHHKSVDDSPLTKNKTLYYEDAFNMRGSHNSPKERVAQDSLVVAALATNISFKDPESKLVADLRLQLSQIYRRPETSMLVTIQQEACLCFGNTSVPAYWLQVFALPSSIAPVTNLRNSKLIQAVLQELLDIAPDRGVIIYTPVGEDNLATNGVTARGEISRLERQDQADSPSIFKSISRSMSRRLKSPSAQSDPFSVTSPSVGTSSSAPTDILRSPIVPGEDAGMLECFHVDDARRNRKRESLRSYVHRLLPEKKQAEKIPEKEND